MKLPGFYFCRKKHCLFIFVFFSCIVFYMLHLSITKTSPICDPGNVITSHQSLLDSKLNSVFKAEKCDLNATLYSDWIVVEPHVFVYSAFIDNIGVPSEIDTVYYIKLLAAVLPSLSILQSSPTNLTCYLKYSDGSVVSSLSFLKILPEHHRKCYKSAFILCSVPNENVFPTDVSLTKDKTERKWIKILSALQSDAKNVTHSTVCVRPLFGPLSSITQLLEFISYYEAMGINRFIFYKYQVTEEVSIFLEFISKLKSLVIKVLPWTLPLIDGQLLHAEGQIIFIQDCLLRSRIASRYVIFLDLDEFIMPQKTLNLTQTLISLENDYPNAGNFLISMVMFCEEYISVWDERELPLVTQILKKRQITPWTHTYRSKFIARSFRIDVGGIHEVWFNVYPFVTINVPATKLMIYHYRSCCGLDQPGFLGLYKFSPLYSDEVIEDLRMEKIKIKMLSSTSGSLIQKILEKKNIC